MTQPRRVLSVAHKQKTVTMPEPQLRGRPISECVEVIALGLSEITGKPLRREMELVAVTDGGSIMSY